jgi:hypothetical protein
MVAVFITNFRLHFLSPPLTAAATLTSFYLGRGSVGGGGGGASFRSADAAQVCNNVGFVLNDGRCECSPTIAARQIVSERW